MSSDCEFEIDQHGGSNDGLPNMIIESNNTEDGNEFMVAQEMIIANDVEAEAEILEDDIVGDDDNEANYENDNQNFNDDQYSSGNSNSDAESDSNDEEEEDDDDDNDNDNEEEEENDDEEEEDEESRQDKEEQQSLPQNDNDDDDGNEHEDEEEEEVDNNSESREQESQPSSPSKNNEQSPNLIKIDEEHQQQPKIQSNQENDNQNNENKQISEQQKSKSAINYEDESEIIKNCNENGVYKWEDFKNSKIRPFSKEEYERYQQPFKYGWKRELVLRLSCSNSDKKSGDVYYHTPDGTTKLRSFVEMTNYLRRNPQITDVDVTNFTYAKQPVFRPPNEIVRNAMQRGANYVERPFAFNRHLRIKQNKSTSNNSLMAINNSNNSFISNNEDSNDNTEGGFGRGKRKRVVPSRYDDEEIELPMNKRFRNNQSNRESFSNNNSNDGHSPQISNKVSSSGSATKMTAQERRRILQQQLYQQVNEEVQKEKEREQQQQKLQQQQKANSISDKESSNRSPSSSLLKMKIIKGQNGNRKVDNCVNGDGENSSLLAQVSSQQQPQQNGHVNGEAESNESIQQSSSEEHQPQSSQKSTNKEDGEVQPVQNSRQPCGTNCPGRRNVLPNLMCYRCFCLFHLECVPDGMFLQNNLFACPNCVTDEDRATNTTTTTTENNNNNNTDIKNSDNSSKPSASISMTNNNNSNKKKINSNSLLLKQQLTNKSALRQTNHSMIIDSSSSPSINSLTSLKRKLQNVKLHRTINDSLLTMKHAMNGQIQGSGKNQFDLINGSNNLNKKSRRIISSYSSTPASLSPHQNIHTDMNTLKFQPGINHVYRLAQSASGHSVVIKDRTQPIETNHSLMNNIGYTAKINRPNTNSNTSINYLQNAQKLLNQNQALLNETAQRVARSQYYSTLNNNGGSDYFNIISDLNLKINPKSKWLKYQQKHFNFFNRFDSLISVIEKLTEYLDFKDVLNLRLINRRWYYLLPTPVIWKHLRLNGLPIMDWEMFGTSIQRSKTLLRSIDFSGVRTSQQQLQQQQSSPKVLTRHEKICQFWRGFDKILSDMNHIELLKFGYVPTFVFENVLDSFEQQQWPNIHTLIVNNLFDADDSNNSCSLKNLSKLSSLQNTLKILRIDSNNGLTIASYDSALEGLKQLMKLHTFECVSLKDLPNDQFAQLFIHLNSDSLKHLAIGSCSTWFIENEKSLFENLSKFSNLFSLRLRNVNINSDLSNNLVNLFESLIVVEHLTLENLIIQKSAKNTWTSLLAMLKSLPLRQLNISTSELFTNRTIFEALIQLLSVQKRRFLKIRWLITVNIDDMGHCMVPLSLESFKYLGNGITDNDGKMFIDQYFGVKINNQNMNNENPSYQLAQTNDITFIMIEIEALKNLIINKLPGFHRKDPTIYSSIEIVPQ